jgi:hypothetical protein
MALSICQSQLTYFHKQVLRKMLAWEAEERPTFVELRDIFQSAQVRLNLDNEAFVESLMKDKIKDTRDVNNDGGVMRIGVPDTN